MITGTTVVFTPDIFNCSYTQVFLFRHPDIVKFSSDAFNVTKTKHAAADLCDGTNPMSFTSQSLQTLFKEKTRAPVKRFCFFP